MVYSAMGQLTQVVLGQSVTQSFDATAVQNQKDNLGSLPLSVFAQLRVALRLSNSGFCCN